VNSDTEPSAHRVLILAPSGRDGVLAAQVLEQAGLLVEVCQNDKAFLDGVAQGAGTAIVAEEALNPKLVARLAEVLRNQLPWSDFPVLIFTTRQASARDNRRALEAFADLGNVTALERPIHPLTMVSAARAALRARARQYNARAAFDEREREVRQRDQFLAMLGHELRNPLGAIQNASQLAQKMAGNLPALDRPMALIHRQVRHLTQLVDDLLDVARVTSGKIVLKETPTDLGLLARMLVEELRRQSGERHLTLEFQGPDEPVIVRGDRVRLEQVVNNLLTNALKYTPAGGRVTVRVEVEAATGEGLLRVTDTGVGISADILPAIFEPFTQSERTLDRAQGGMGLGLSVVRALVQLHGGKVTATSPGLGKGATFEVRLPLLLTSGTRDEDVTPIVPLLNSSGCTRHVLIVEDGADNRESLTELLESLGHRVDVAVDGEEGVERALALRPEVALIDIGLPRLDGFEVARRIRAAVGSQMFLIALTGYGQPEDRARAVAAGFDVHLTKPMDLDALERLLGTLQVSPPAQASRGR
jgi:signal transduction histidine kinase/ActR/RegA family two-component response regulator